MKNPILSLILGLGLVATSLAQNTQNYQTLHRQGLAAMSQNKPEIAKQYFEQALKLNPRHSPSRYQLSLIPDLIEKVKIQERQNQMNAVILPEVAFSNATVAEAVEAINAASLNASDQKFSPNLIIQDPNNTLKDRTITLQLKNTPVSAVIRYLNSLAGTQTRLDQHATIIRPVTTANPEPTPAE